MTEIHIAMTNVSVFFLLLMYLDMMYRANLNFNLIMRHIIASVSQVLEVRIQY